MAGAPDTQGAASAELPPRRDPAPVLFVGGTGRSGSHVMARLLAKSPAYQLIPLEVRFHVDDDGFPGLLSGEVSKDAFVRRLRGFWWKGFQTDRFRGLHNLVPRERFESAVASFEERYDADPEEACRRLFLDLLVGVKGKPPAEGGPTGIIEQSCDTIAQAATLVRLFPEARFVHAIRDGRNASASRVEQRRWLVYPRTRNQGLDWWERRIRRVDRGARAIPEGQLLEVDLASLVIPGPRRKDALRRMARFAGIRKPDRMRRFVREKMGVGAANEERWRRGLSKRRQAELDQRYLDLLGRLERDGVSAAPILRESHEMAERRRARGAYEKHR